MIVAFPLLALLPSFAAASDMPDLANFHRQLDRVSLAGESTNTNNRIATSAPSSPDDSTNETKGPIIYRSFDLSGLPREFDWRSPENYAKYGSVVTPVKNQGYCRGCWAFSTIESVESAMAIRTGRLEELSPSMVIDCAPKGPFTGGCGGSSIPWAFDYLASVGGGISAFRYGYSRDFAGVKNETTGKHSVAPFDNGKHCALTTNHTEVKEKLVIAPVAGYRRLEKNNATEVMQTLMEHGPLALTIDATNWWDYTGGIFDCNAPELKTDNWVNLNHGVLLVGWGEENGTPYWTIRNSFGTQYGEKGYIRLKRAPAEHVPCYIDRSPSKPNRTVCGACGMLQEVYVPVLPDHIELRESERPE